MKFPGPEYARMPRMKSLHNYFLLVGQGQGSISPSFYKQLLRAHIPKSQKDSQIKQLFELFGPACVKTERKHVDEIDPDLGNILHFILASQEKCDEMMC